MPAGLPTLVADLKDAFPRQPLSPGTVKVYVRELGDLPLPHLEAAVRELIRTSEFFPTVAAIRAATVERMLGLPSEGEALAQIEARAAWGRATERPPVPPIVHPLVTEALAHVGGFHSWRNAERPEVIRGQFGRLYREARERAIRETQVGAALAAAGDRKELTK